MDDEHRIPRLVEEYHAAANDLLRRDDLWLSIGEDLCEFVRALQDAPGNRGVNPTFNPDVTGAGIAVWIDVRTGPQRVAVMAVRLIETAGYYNWVREGCLWGCGPLELAISEPGPAGKLSHTGGLWVHPSWRGIGLSWLLPRLIRVLAIQLWNIDGSTGLVFESLHRTGLATKNYGAQRARLLFDGWFPPTAQPERLFALEYDLDYLLKGMRDDVLLIRDQCNKKMRDLAPIAGKRDNQAAVHADPSSRLQIDLR